jgi:hypothetical protein
VGISEEVAIALCWEREDNRTVAFNESQVYLRNSFPTYFELLVVHISNLRVFSQ